MGDKETVRNLIHRLPAEVTLTEILREIESLAAIRNSQPSAQIHALRTSTEAAAILTQALADRQSRKHAPEN